MFMGTLLETLYFIFLSCCRQKPMKITSRKQIKNKEKSDEFFREFTAQLPPGLTENDPKKEKNPACDRCLGVQP